MSRERPILFSAPMVRAILEGRKTQTRRVVRPGRGQKWLKPEALGAVARWAPSEGAWWTMAVGKASRIIHCGHEMDGGHIGSVRCPFGEPGDLLWVREAWLRLACPRHEEGQPPGTRCGCGDPSDFRFAADCSEMERAAARWRPSIHMPKWAARIWLEVTGVRVEKLQDISEEDAWSEGIESVDGALDNADIAKIAARQGWCIDDARPSFGALWASIYGAESWDANPWVWVIEFKRVEREAVAA